MNKLFTKIAALALGATMAVGVGVAVASSNDAAPAYAASAWQAHTGAITAGNEYLIVKVSADKCMKPTNTSSSGSTTTSAGSYSQVTFSAASGPDLGFIFENAGSGKFYIRDGTTYVRANGTTNNGLCSAANNTTNPNYGIWTVTETSTSGQYTIINANSRQLSAYSTSNWRSYATTSTGSITNVKLYEKAKTAQTITASADSAYSDESVTLTTNANSATWSITSGASYAHLSSTSGKSVSLVGDAVGSVTVKAVASGYTDATKTITFTERPTSPFITPAKSSTSGYTGQNETLSFTYGNLTSTLGVSSSNTSVVTVDSPSTSAGEGTVQINFVGAGSTTVKFNDGSTELASVSVSVTASSVTITGLAASSTAYVGKTLNLGSTITVTATGIYTNAVTWESEDDDIATVSTAGVVTGVAEGTVDITVTSDDYPSATMTCAVTVEAAPISDLLRTPSTSLNYTTTSYGDVSGITKTGHSDITSEATYAGHFMCATSPRAGAIQLNPSKSTFICTTASSQYLNSIAITFNDANGKGVKFYASNTAYTATYNAEGSASSTLLHTSTSSDSFTVSGNYKYLYIVPTGTTYVDSIEVTWKAAPELSSVTTSGQTTSFVAGNKFSYGGTLTAHYTAGKADATVSPAYFKYGASGINPTTAGTAITTAVTMEVGEHSGKYIYVVYTEDNITKWASYQITVNYAPVTSVVIDTHAAEIGLNETYDYNLVGVTVNTEYAQQGYEWIVSGNTVNNDYAFNASGLLSGDTEGTITLRCRSTADNSKYDELVVTVTGDPTASFTPASVSGYAGKSVDVEFTYGNIDNENLISIISSNTSAVTVGTIIAENDEGLVTINLIASGNSTLSISYNGGETLDSVVVTVSNDSVVALNWTASNIKCYSGVVLPVSIEDTWMVNYEMASGDADYITYSDGDYTVKLGGSTITLPHTWSAEDNGKTLCVEYMGFQSSTVTVDVTQTLQAVMASETSSWDYTFTAKAWSAKGDWTLDDKLWNMSGTDDGSPYFGYDATKGQQFGSGSHPFSDVSLQSSAFSGTIDSVTVYTSGANSINATVQVSVGGTAYGDAQTITATNTPYTFDLGGKSGTISIDYVNSSSKAIYIKEIVVNTVSGSHNIANASGHEAAQKAVVKFAKAFNAAMDTTENCTTNMSSAWSTATTAWNTFTSEAAALGSTEEAYAKNLIKYATAQWTKNTDSDYSYCLERAMATYEKCVSDYEMTAFMSAVRPVGRSANINPISIIGSKSDINVISIVVITSVISLTAIGGYFFLRKRKENI